MDLGTWKDKAPYILNGNVAHLRLLEIDLSIDRMELDIYYYQAIWLQVAS